MSGGSEKQVCAYGMCDGDHFLWRSSTFSWLCHVYTITRAPSEILWVVKYKALVKTGGSVK